MKIRFIIPLISLLLFFGCSIDDDSGSNGDVSRQVEIFQWHLINVSGGIAGVDVDYEMDTIIWVFNVSSNTGAGTLQVENSNGDDTLEDGLGTGNYPVSIPVFGSNSILHIDGNEFGGLSTPTADDMIIDQNVTSSGMDKSDGFIYTFKRKVVTETI